MATAKKIVDALGATGGRKDSIETSKSIIETFQEMLKEQTKNILQNMVERFKQMDDRFQQLEDKIDSKIALMEQRMEAKFANHREEMTGKFEEIKEKVQQIEIVKTDLLKDMEEIQTIQSKQDAQIIMMQFRLMENALRFRAFPEARNQNLKDIFSQALADMMGVSQDEMNKEIDRIYRVNSRIAEQRGLPRDIVIYFTTKTMRYRILEVSYKGKFVVQQKEVKVLKEIPSKMLQARRDFFFLTKELRSRKLDYKWEVPSGLTVWVQDKRYYLDTILKAQKFYHETLKVPVEEMVEILPKEQQEEFSKEKSCLQEDLISTQQNSVTPAAPIKQRAVGKCLTEVPKNRNRGRRRAVSRTK